MKKINHTLKWKYHSKKRSENTLKRRRRKKKKQLLTSVPKYKKVKTENNKIIIKAPDNFSLINNVEETLDFFSKFGRYIRKRRQIYLNMSEVKDLTTDAIVYILSYLEFNRHSGFRARIYGNEPENNHCKIVLRSSGFFKYTYSSTSKKVISNPDYYSIESGARVRSPRAAEVKKFAMKKLKLQESPETKSIYTTIIESMVNTKHHAYGDTSVYSKWWLMASYNKKANLIHFTFLDNGHGIPTTIRMNFSDRVKELLSGITSKHRDGFLINSALDGEFRTRTRKQHRGKGLPQIRRAADEDKINNLIIISKRGYVNRSKQEVIELSKPFRGTLLSWSIKGV